MYISLRSSHIVALATTYLFQHFVYLCVYKCLSGVDGPVVSLAGAPQRLGQLDEALVQGQVVPHRVLPTLVRTTEKRKLSLK